MILKNERFDSRIITFGTWSNDYPTWYFRFTDLHVLIKTGVNTHHDNLPILLSYELVISGFTEWHGKFIVDLQAFEQFYFSSLLDDTAFPWYQFM